MQFIAEIKRVFPGPELELLIDRNTADIFDELFLCCFPQSLLLGSIGFDTGSADLAVSNIAMVEVGDGGRGADDGGRVIELGQIDIGNREAGSLIMHHLRQILADLGMERSIPLSVVWIVLIVTPFG